MKKYLIYAAIVLVAGIAALVAIERISKLRSERDRYKGNMAALFTEVEKYKTKDSLNAAKVVSLELTVKEFKKFREEDAELIKSLRTKNRDLAAVNKTQSQTIIHLQAIPKDTVVLIKDSILVPAVHVHCGDAWYDFHGFLADEVFTGELQNRDSLVLAETVKYKRFLGFLWKTKKVKDRQVDVVSKNPHTEILGMEHIVIEH
jgi:hypothetical protein